MKKPISIALLITLLFGIALMSKTEVLAHDADGVYYVPSIVDYGIRDYAGVTLYYKLPGVEDKDTSIPSISKPISRMKVTANGQTAYDSQIITSTVGKPIVIDFSQSTSNDAPIAEIGLQVTNGTGSYQNCWTSLPGGSAGSSYAGQYPFSWGSTSFTPDKPGTYTIYGEVRADIDKSEVFEHWDVWSANGSHPIVDTIQAHTSYPAGPIQSYSVTWHFEQVTVIVSQETPNPTVVLTSPPDGTIKSLGESFAITGYATNCHHVGVFINDECVEVFYCEVDTVTGLYKPYDLKMNYTPPEAGEYRVQLKGRNTP
jgi:hypothetical protein